MTMCITTSTSRAAPCRLRSLLASDTCIQSASTAVWRCLLVSAAGARPKNARADAANECVRCSRVANTLCAVIIQLCFAFLHARTFG